MGGSSYRTLYREGFLFNTNVGVKEHPGGGGALPYKGLTGTCGPTGYGFQDFCLERGIYFAPVANQIF